MNNQRRAGLVIFLIVFLFGLFFVQGVNAQTEPGTGESKPEETPATPAPDGNQSKVKLTGSIKFNITNPKEGDTIKATYSGNGNGTKKWQWLTSDNKSISGSINSEEYTIKNTDVGKKIKALVTIDNYEGSVSSPLTAVVTVNEEAEIKALVTIIEGYSGEANKEYLKDKDAKGKIEEAVAKKFEFNTPEMNTFINNAQSASKDAEPAKTEVEKQKGIIEKEITIAESTTKLTEAKTAEQKAKAALSIIKDKVTEANGHYDKAIEFAEQAISMANAEKRIQNIEANIRIITQNGEILIPGNILLIIFAFIFITILFLFILIIIHTKKINIIIDNLNTYNGSFESKISVLENKYYSLSGSITKAPPVYRDTPTSSVKDQDHEDRIFKIEQQIREQSGQNNKFNTEIQRIQKIIGNDSGGGNEGKPVDIVSQFNMWASNPNVKLPFAFYYINNEPKRNIAQNFNESSAGAPTKWILNRNGNIKYLFPNPNFMDDVTDISEFYLMDLTRLKPKGLNKIKIVEPCKIEDDIIRFQGKLDLL